MIDTLVNDLKEECRRFPCAVYHISLTPGYALNDAEELVYVGGDAANSFIARLNGKITDRAFGLITPMGKQFMLNYDLFNRAFRM